jgi:cytochrome d ubiquinol oxidase subunit I
MGGVYSGTELKYALRIPYGLSLLVDRNPNGPVTGLDRVPPDQRPPVNVTHLSYDLMVAIGSALVLLTLWLAWTWWRRRDIPGTRWFLRAVAVSGAAAVLALEAGWTATEVGRQPWIVYEVMRTAQAVSPAPGLKVGFYAVTLVYIVLTVLTVRVMRRLAGRHENLAPQEPAPRDAAVPG